VPPVMLATADDRVRHAPAPSLCEDWNAAELAAVVEAQAPAVKAWTLARPPTAAEVDAQAPAASFATRSDPDAAVTL